MSDTNPTPAEIDLEALRKRSAELIAEMARINRRIDETTAGPADQAISDPATTDPAMTDTWVDSKNSDDSAV